MATEQKEIENTSYSECLKTQESFCSECKNEIAIDQNQDKNTLNKSLCSSCRSEVVTDELQSGEILMKFYHEKIICSKCNNKDCAHEDVNSEEIDKDHLESEELINELITEAFENNQELLRATQSLSQISLDIPAEKEDNQLSHPQSIEINNNEFSSDHEAIEFILLQDNEDQPNTIEIGEKNLDFPKCDENTVDIIVKNLNDELENQLFYKQVVPTEDENKENEPLWDPEFPSETELEKIDNSVREEIVMPAFKCKRKLDFDNIDANFKVTKKSKDIVKLNVNTIVSAKLNREKHLVDLANDLYELSSYLNDIGKAVNVKEFNNKTSIKIPTAPKIIGYDSKFDCLNQSRFPKLPINIENNDLNKFNGSSESLNSKQRVKTSSKKSLNGALTQKNAKVMSNNKGVGVPKKTFYQTTLKEAFSYGKENKNIQNSNTAYNKKPVNKKNLTKDINYTNGNDRSMDSTSMYDFNPLRSSTFTKEK